MDELVSRCCQRVCSIFSVSKKKWWASLEEKTLQSKTGCSIFGERGFRYAFERNRGTPRGRDHTTIARIKKVSELLKNDDKFKRRVDIIYNELNLS